MMSDKIEKNFLLIMGMHRSGTSFLTRALNLGGVYLGELDSIASHEWIPIDDNLKGNWEHKKLLELGEKTLEENNGNWHNIPDKITISSELGNEIANALQELTKPNTIAVGFKDPRLVINFEAWKNLLPKKIIIVGIFRNPLKVAESLKKRNGFTYEKSLNLWKIYNTKLLQHLENYNGFLLDFDWNKEELVFELSKIFKKLDLVDSTEILDWYSDDLVTSDKNYLKSYSLSPEIELLYANLVERSKKNNQIKLDIKKRSTEELMEILKELLLELKKQGDYFKKIYDDNLAKIATLESHLKEKDSEINRLKNQISKQQTDIENLQKIIAEIHNSITWKILRKYDKIIGKSKK